MANKKAKRNWKTYTIEVRTDVSFVTEIEVKADNILNAGREALKIARQDCLAFSVPSDATLNRVEVEIEDGWSDGDADKIR